MERRKWSRWTFAPGVNAEALVKVKGGDVVLEISPLEKVDVAEIVVTNGSDVIFCAVNALITPVPSSV